MELLDGVEGLSGVGAKRASALSRLGIATLFDLLTYYPRAYIDQSTVRQLATLSAGMEATVFGTIVHVNERRAMRGISVLNVRLSDGTGFLSMTWFNQPYLAKKLVVGRRVLATGKIEYAYGGRGLLAMTQMAAFEVMDEGNGVVQGQLLPVYAATASLNQRFFRDLMKQALQKKPEMPEVIPESVRSRYALMGRDEAFRFVHFPPSIKSLAESRARLAF